MMKCYSQNRIKRLLRPIRLRLFDANCLRGRFQLDAIEVKMKRAHLLQAGLGLHKHAVAMQLHVARDLKVIFLLTNESIVRVGEVEAFVGVNAKVWDRPEVEMRDWNVLHGSLQ